MKLRLIVLHYRLQTVKLRFYRNIFLYSVSLKKELLSQKNGEEENFISIGGGYVETDGTKINILVSRAYGQDEIDENEIVQAKTEAEHLLKTAATEEERQQALNSLRHSIIDFKLIGKVKKRKKI